MEDQYWYDAFGNAKFSFYNPYYIPDGLPQTTAASEYYNDAVKQGSWFGVNVLDDWLSSADDSNYGNLETSSKWSLGPAYVIQGDPHEVIGIRANFTGPSLAGAMYYLVINRPAESTMLRYRIDPASIPSSWYQLTGADMLGDSLGDASPLMQDDDSIAFVNFIPNDHMQSYEGQDIRTQFRIGPSLIDQLMSIPLWVEHPSPSPPPSPPPPSPPPPSPPPPPSTPPPDVTAAAFELSVSITVEPGTCTMIPSDESIEVSGLGSDISVAADLTPHLFGSTGNSLSQLLVNGLNVTSPSPVKTGTGCGCLCAVKEGGA